MHNYGMSNPFSDLCVTLMWHGFWNEIRDTHFEKLVLESIWRNLMSACVVVVKKGVWVCIWGCYYCCEEGLEELETMFWRDRERENKEHNGGVLCGQVRVLVVGDSGSLFFLRHPFFCSVITFPIFMYFNFWKNNFKMNLFFKVC